MSNTTLQLFEYSGQQVRTVLLDGQPGFVAADVAKILGYRMSSDMTRSLDPDELGTRLVRTPSGEQEMTIISEPGLYQATMQRQTARMTNKETRQSVKNFQRWVTHEVLPEIRKTGSYGKPAELTRADLAQMVLDAEREKAELVPRAEAWDTLAGANGDYSVAEAAQVLSRDDRITIGRNRLFEFMGHIGWLYRGAPRNSWHAYQDQVDNGRLVRRMSSAFQNQKTGELELPAPTIRITVKGVEALRTRLLEEVAA